MRGIISIFLFTLYASCFCQRQTFKDPDIEWSFNKPSDWQVFDDGLVVKVSPSASDSSSTYLSFTYYQDAIPIGIPDAPEIMQPGDSVITEIPTPDKVKIGKFSLQRGSLRLLKSERWLIMQRYQFNDTGLRWEIITSTPEDAKRNHQKTFRKVIRSLRVSN